MQGEGLTTVELVIVIVVVLVVMAVLVPNCVRPSPEIARRASCQNNLKQMGLVFKMYASETEGELWPGLRRCAGADCSDNVDAAELWVPDGPSIYPQFLTNLEALFCPNAPEGDELLRASTWTADGTPQAPIAPCKIAPVSYTYLPWVILPDVYLTDPATVGSAEPIEGLLRADFAEKMGSVMAQMTGACESGGFSVFDQDIEFEGATAHRTRNGVERLLIADAQDPAASARAQSELPIMHDSIPSASTVFNHIPDGANVLYMDGHVQFIRHSSKFPICETWSKTFAMLLETE